jgi:hypothetical protein
MICYFVGILEDDLYPMSNQWKSFDVTWQYDILVY